MQMSLAKANLSLRMYLWWSLWSLYIYLCNRVYCIHIPGHDTLIFSFLSFILFDWVGVLWPQLSKVLKPVRWAGSAPFPPASLQRWVVCLLLRLVFMFSSQGRARHCFLVGWCANKKLCWLQPGGNLTLKLPTCSRTKIQARCEHDKIINIHYLHQ